MAESNRVALYPRLSLSLPYILTRSLLSRPERLQRNNAKAKVGDKPKCELHRAI